MNPNALCEDCRCPLKDHDGQSGRCLYCGCKCFMPEEPKGV